MKSMAPSPETLNAILADAERLGFPYSSESQTGSLLAALVASKPRGRVLELGTGLGYGTCWLHSGLHAQSTLTTVEANARNSQIAQGHLGHDKRLRFVVRDAGVWLEEAPSNWFDLIFADSPEGKYAHLDDALRTLTVGGLYVVDDMRRKTDGTDEYLAPAMQLIELFTHRPDFVVTQMTDFATGVLMAVKIR
jgi:predicted O-methyltransferase YrrM